MQKIIWTFGLIGGAVVTLLMLTTSSLWMGDDAPMDMGTGEILGYVSMIVALSTIFFGIRSYRDKHLGGRITFGKAFRVGLLITLVASVIYVAGWMLYFNVSEAAQQFPDRYLDYLVAQMHEAGKSQAEIDAETAKYRENMELYKNPLVMTGVTLMEILPVGLLITLASSLILKRK